MDILTEYENENILQAGPEQKETLQADPDQEVTLQDGPEHEETLQDRSVSENTVSENNINEDILYELRGLREDVQSISNNIVFLRDDFNNSNSVETVGIVSENTVSRNMIITPLNEYTLSEQLQLFGVFIGLCTVIVIVIHKSIMKWRK